MEYNVYVQLVLYLECNAVIMGIQVPLMIIDLRQVSVITGVFTDRRVTH